MIAQRLPGDRLHLHHGPIDVVLRGWGEPRDVARAEQAAAARFATILEELVAELAALRRDARERPALRGVVARRMAAACAPFAAEGIFVTAMAAVAGAVADELLGTMRQAAPALRKAFVNDGGDIAVFATPGETLEIGLVGGVVPPHPHPTSLRPPAPSAPKLPQAGEGAGRATFDGTLRITHAMQLGGMATSGRHGRSFSLGIADAVSVLAHDAATADAAATLIANAVTLDSPAIARRPARDLDPDSDLGDLPVTVAVGALAADEIEAALDAGAARAAAWCQAGLIRGAALRLGGAARILGPAFPALTDHAA